MSNKAACDKCGAIGRPSMNWTSTTTNICVDCQRENVKDVPLYTPAQAEPLLARITFLEAQVEKMRNCDNCKYLGASLWEDDRDPCWNCHEKLEKWEVRK